MASPILGSAGNEIDMLATYSCILLSFARILRTKAIFHVHRGRSALEDAKGRDNRRRHAVLGLVDLEVAQRPLRLGSPVLVRGHFDLAKGIALDSLVGHVGSCGVDSSVAGGNSRRGGLQN